MVLVLWAMIGFAPIVRNQNDISSAGTFGDSFGMVNSFFTCLAFLLIVATAYLQYQALEKQTEQIQMQREELKLQRTEMKEAREQFTRQAEAQESSDKRMLLASYVTISELIHDISSSTKIPVPKTDTPFFELDKFSKKVEILSKLNCLQYFAEIELFDLFADLESESDLLDTEYIVGERIKSCYQLLKDCGDARRNNIEPIENTKARAHEAIENLIEFASKHTNYDVVLNELATALLHINKDSNQSLNLRDSILHLKIALVNMYSRKIAVTEPRKGAKGYSRGGFSVREL